VKLQLYIAAALGALGLIFALYYMIREDAQEAERAKQEKANAEFIIKTQKGRSTYDECDAADGVYDFAKGTCQLQTTR
jgi:hypothetical protein